MEGMLYFFPGITIYFCLLAAILGACMASFLNCMAWRIVHGESFVKGWSHCDECGHSLALYDLIPIFSYLFQKGKCRYCGTKLSVRHLLFEILGAVSFVLLLLKFDITIQTLEYLGLACILMGAAFTDIEGLIIPDGFIIAGVFWHVAFVLFTGPTLPLILDDLIGGFGVALVLLGIVLIVEKVMKREAMGGGDLKLIFMNGLYLGWAKNILCIFIACVIGIIVGLATKKQREENDELEDKKIFPWGPSIAAAAYLTVLAGDSILNAYLSLF